MTAMNSADIRTTHVLCYDRTQRETIALAAGQDEPPTDEIVRPVPPLHGETPLPPLYGLHRIGGERAVSVAELRQRCGVYAWPAGRGLAPWLHVVLSGLLLATVFAGLAVVLSGCRDWPTTGGPATTGPTPTPPPPPAVSVSEHGAAFVAELLDIHGGSAQ